MEKLNSQEITSNIDLEGCQIPCVANMGEGIILSDPQPLVMKIKRLLARPWNFTVKPIMKKIMAFERSLITSPNPNSVKLEPQKIPLPNSLQAGDLVKVRSLEEIHSTLNNFKELKGCAFLPYMKQYCGTTQRVLKPVERFLDERDYQVKKSHGVVLLGGVICEGTPVFGRCDRACHLFWRVEWLEKIDE